MRSHGKLPMIGVWVLLTAVPLGFLVVFFLWPVLSLTALGLSDGFAGVIRVLTDPRTVKVFGNTIVQGISGSFVSVVLGLPFAYVLYKLPLPGVAFARTIMMVPFVLPTVVVAVAFASLVGRDGILASWNLEHHFITIVAALAFFNVTLVARMVGTFWAQLDPRPEQAARMLGASAARVFFTITLPALAPAIAAAAALVFLYCATSFGLVLILGGRSFGNLETEIYRSTVQYFDLNTAAMLSLLQAAVVLLALFVSSRFRELTVGMTAARRAPRRHDAWVIAVCAVTALVLHGLPMWALLRQSFRGRSGEWSLSNYQNLFDPVYTSELRINPLSAAATSITMALISTVLTVALALCTVLVASRRPRSRWLRRLIGGFDTAMMMPVGISAVTLGFGLLLTMHRPLGIGVDLRTSVVLIPVAQTLVALPLVLRTLLPVLRGIDPRTREAAMMLGAGPFRVLRTIDLPMLGRAGGVALGFAFATALGEFGATAFLVRPGTQTLPVMIARLQGRPGEYGVALAAAVLLGLATAVIMVVAERSRVKWAGEGAG